MEEIWKDIEGYGGYYQVSTLGRVRSIDRVVKGKNGRDYTKKGKILKPFNFGGYLNVGLFGTLSKPTQAVHRLVAFAFIPNPENKPCVNHINGVKTDNRLENLEWVTNYENSQHAINVLGVAPWNKGKGIIYDHICCGCGEHFYNRFRVQKYCKWDCRNIYFRGYRLKKKKKPIIPSHQLTQEEGE